MSTKSNCLVLMLSLISFAGFTQKKIKDGFVVLNNGDTARGYLEYKEWYTNPISVLFTKNLNEAGVRYSTNEIIYFEYNGMGLYQRFTVGVSLDNESLSNFSVKDTSSTVRTVFLKILQKGSNVTLFSYRDELKRRFYILEHDATTPVELLNSIYMQNGQVKEEKQYRTVLNRLVSKYLSGDINMFNQVNNSGYNNGAIENICLKLNGGIKKEIVKPTSVKGQSRFRFFVGGGIGQNNLKMHGDNRFAGLTSGPFTFPVVDAGADYAFNPIVGRLRLRLQMHVTRYKTNAYVFKDFQQYTEEYYFRFKQTNVVFEPQVLYNIYNQKNLKWYISAGPGLNFSTYPLNEQYAIRKSSTNSEVTDNNYMKSLQKFWVNGCFSTGVDFHRIELGVVYFTKASVTQTPGFGLDNSSVQVRANFYIKK